MRHCNIPVFVPNMGCPHMCVFCDQRQISGKNGFSIESARRDIELALSTIPGDAECEIAFFGGSFTGIPRNVFTALCELGREYVGSGRVSALRCSTRPDMIDPDICERLQGYGFHTVELGIQSTDDRVLEMSRRGHTAEDSFRACRTVKESGLTLGCQMMEGLPGSTRESDLQTARDIVAAGASEARIYPAVVFSGTEMSEMYRSGIYEPLSVDEAADRCASILDIFDAAGIKVLRTGLCENEGLDHAEAGPSVPDMGERAASRLFFRRACEALDGMICAGMTAVIEVPPGAVSKMVGRRRANAGELNKKYGLKGIRTVENPALKGYNISVRLI